MWTPLLLLTVVISKCNTQNDPSSSVVIEKDNLDDSIIEIFNRCKCVIFYLCDEDNFIITGNIADTKVPSNHALRRVRRLTCSNQWYFCCQNRTATPFPLPPSLQPTSTSSAPKVAPNPDNCGQGAAESSKIIEQFPWTVAIFKKNSSRVGYAFKCGGALIHPKVVLTGVHCVYSSNATSLKVTGSKEALNKTTRTPLSRIVAKIIKHEEYYSGGLYNDIALLILAQPISGVSPLCLPTTDQNFDGKQCVAAGWGGTTGSRSRLRKVEVPMVEAGKCQELLRTTDLGVDFNLHSSFICAGGEGGDTCEGDGGSPLMCMESNRYVHAGVVSWGVENCSRSSVPSLYTNVAKFRSWIDDKLREENLVISRFG